MAECRLTVLVLSILVLSALPLPANAEDSGGVQASSSTVFITPSDPVEGGSATIRLTLTNTNNFEAEDVLWKMYWDGVSPSKLLEANSVDIPAQQSVDIQVVKSGLTVGEHKVWVSFDYASAGEQLFYHEFNVMGLADIEVTSIVSSPSEINSGDQVAISVLLENTGSEDAPSSRAQFNFGTNSEVLNVTSIPANSTLWLNHTMTAPETGTHEFNVIVDLDDAVVEADESNTFTHSIAVSPRIDFLHVGDLTIEIDENSLNGPWEISGEIKRTGSDQNVTVPMKLSITDQSGGELPLPLFDVVISGQDGTSQSWSFSLLYQYVSTLPSGSHEVTAIIDPFESLTQETIENDRISTYFNKYEIPDVAVDPIAFRSKTEVNSGENVEWTVSITNAGDVEVKGHLIYTWEGLTFDQNSEQMITLQSGETYLWNKVLSTASGTHTAYFNATWVSLQTSYDDNPMNSIASGTIPVSSELRLSFSRSTMSLTDAEGLPVQLPLTGDEEYKLSIKASAQEVGQVNFSCEDEKGYEFQLIPIQVNEIGEILTIECTFVASAPSTTVSIISENSRVADTQTWTLDTKVPEGQTFDEKEQAAWGTVTIIGFMAGFLVLVLVAAIILTRKVDEEVERDIFDYCPACDGELSGGEDRCPSCSFNLKKARKQFHDCDTCNESIPDLLSNCPYCGATQDVTKYFERREKREVTKETIPLVEEEEIDPETIHAAGYENFDEAVKEFGYDAEDLEGHWDENIAAAEAEMEAAYDRRVASEVELDEEEALATVTTTLKSVAESFEGHDLDAFLGEKDLQSRIDDGTDDELSASDADIRGELYEITGEDGVMPGDEVQIGMGIQDRSLAGNDLPEEAMDFSFEDEADEVNPVAAAKANAKRRRGVRRRAKEETKLAECGACGADIGQDATECGTCGAKFE
ncbi:MAG: CARDB domain-containing protein [Candidatus Poseidoniaceae archaeon]|jgi:hypothetical protein|nr:CARDB domain-containing protein [Candidatus Poseidoniaceae archaeon]